MESHVNNEGNAEKRVIKSRLHTKEERKEQKRRYRKKKRDKKRSELQNGNKESEISSREDLVSNKATCKPFMVGSRAAVIVDLAKKQKHQAVGTSTLKSTDKIVVRRNESNTHASGVREINPKLLQYSSLIGSGSYGDCYFAKYRGIEVVVKRGKKRDNSRDSKRVMQEVIHEGHVINSLGDHEGLPLLFGMVTKKLPICLVLQFHGDNKKSLTLYQAAEEKLISKTDCLSIFDKICDTLSYVHVKGFLHNDIKSNNVVLEERSSGYFPILIDFGKSKKISSYVEGKVPGKLRGQRSYLAPEVITGNESTTSDVFSLGYMLKCVSKQLDFIEFFSTLVASACKENLLQRFSLKECHHVIKTA